MKKKEKIRRSEWELIISILLLEVFFATFCVFISAFIAFDTCLYLLFAGITVINVAGAFQIEVKLNEIREVEENV